MSAASQVLQWVLGGAFVLLGALTLSEWLSHRDRTRGYLAASVSLLGAVALIGSIESLGISLHGSLTDLSLLLFVGSGFALLLFRHSLVPLSRVAMGVSSALVAASAVFVLGVYIGGTPEQLSGLQGAAAIVLLCVWAACVIDPIIRVWRLSNRRPAVQQARLRSLLIAYAGVIVVLTLSVVAGFAHWLQPQVRIGATVLTCLIVPLFYVAFAPPGWVRQLWREREEQGLREALSNLLLFSPDRTTLAERAVGWAARLVGADAALIATDDGVLATWGSDPDDAWELEGGTGEQLHPGNPRGRAGVIQIPIASHYTSGIVAVRAGPLTPLFGEEEVGRLRTYVNAITTALDRVLLVEQLRRQGELLDLTFNPVITWNVKTGKISYWNRGATSLYGWTAEEAVGRTPDEVLRSVLPVSREQIVRDMLARGEWEAEIRQQTREGRELIVNARWALQVDSQGNPDTVLEINRDVTRERQAVRDLHKARDQAEKASSAKSDYLSRMSHELRTPLTAILGYSDLLELREPRDDQLEAVEAIQQASSHLLSLVNDVLDIARIESGNEQIAPETVVLSTVAEEALRLVAPAARQFKVTMTHELDNARGAMVDADRQRLLQVLLNLLSNAVKYSGAGATVTLRVRPARNSRIRIEVADTGPGLSRQDVARLFEPFERLGAERTPTEGTGLGLALAKRLVEAMKGRIGVDTAPGQGSTFWVELRQAAAVDAPLEDRPRREAMVAVSGGTQHTVLYVEDNLATIGLMEEVFAMRPNIRLITSMQGRLALELAREHRPDLIILDLHLPDLGGDEILQALKDDPTTTDIPVVMFSADATQRQQARLIEIGARAYLVKPAKVNDFLEMLDEVLQPMPVAAAG